MKSNFTAPKNHLHANNLAEEKTQKEVELEAISKQENKYETNLMSKK